MLIDRSISYYACGLLGYKVALARVEQLSPFPFDLAIKDLQIYPNLKSVVWAQEEPMNQGERLIDRYEERQRDRRKQKDAEAEITGPRHQHQLYQI